MMFQKILDLIQQYNTIIIHRHSRPDGDAMGSQLGMKHLICDNFPDKRVYVVGDKSRFLSFMDDAEMDELPDNVFDGALAILLDSAVPSLISDERYKLAAATARIDHHIYCETFTDAEVIDSSYESCCGLITAFAIECGLHISKAAATALYTGMVTDSGRFRYDSTTAQTFRMAAKLMEADVDTTTLYGNLYADDFENKRLKASFTLKVKFTPNNVAYIYTTKEEVAALGVDTFTISRGMVGTMADTKGVDIWVNFTESEDGVLCELRSSRYNINPIAVKYGGGGHQKASGATVENRAVAMAMLEDLDRLQGENI